MYASNVSALLSRLQNDRFSVKTEAVKRRTGQSPVMSVQASFAYMTFQSGWLMSISSSPSLKQSSVRSSALLLCSRAPSQIVAGNDVLIVFNAWRDTKPSALIKRKWQREVRLSSLAFCCLHIIILFLWTNMMYSLVGK